jgi:hypothetical protein
MRTEAWALQKPNGSFVSSKRIDPTNPIKIALFNTKRHAKVFFGRQRISNKRRA